MVSIQDGRPKVPGLNPASWVYRDPWADSDKSAPVPNSLACRSCSCRWGGPRTANEVGTGCARHRPVLSLRGGLSRSRRCISRLWRAVEDDRRAPTESHRIPVETKALAAAACAAGTPVVALRLVAARCREVDVPYWPVWTSRVAAAKKERFGIWLTHSPPIENRVN